MTRMCLALAGALLIARLPSLVQPMGADQSLYAYVGDRILHGELPYRDAWDQKPPAIHYTYAAMRAVWPHDAVVALADLLAATACAWLLLQLGSAVGSRPAGAAAALLFLFLSNPGFTRLAGVRLRSQCETFIAVAVTGAFVLLARHQNGRGAQALGAGILFGIAFCFKYNAAVYAAAGVLALWLWRRLTPGDVLRLSVGFCVPVALLLAVFAASSSLETLYDATILYNLRYSGETYAGAADFVRYLVQFPVQYARVDALWTLGGAGCLLLLAFSVRDRAALVPVVWVAAACLSIAINGSRGLPQYFVQAAPALALAAGWAGALLWVGAGGTGRSPVRRWVAVTMIVAAAIAVWRVNDFSKLLSNTAHDTRYALGRISPSEHLARYSDERKYSSLAAAELGSFMRSTTQPDDRVYVFGFTSAAYVYAGRVSASRFFWSRPVIVGFNSEKPGYGVGGLLQDLERTSPAVVALQRRDWAPDVQDSAQFFMATPPLADWLRSHYELRNGPDGFDTWVRR